MRWLLCSTRPCLMPIRFVPTSTRILASRIPIASGAAANEAATLDDVMGRRARAPHGLDLRSGGGDRRHCHLAKTTWAEGQAGRSKARKGASRTTTPSAISQRPFGLMIAESGACQKLAALFKPRCDDCCARRRRCIVATWHAPLTLPLRQRKSDIRERQSLCLGSRTGTRRIRRKAIRRVPLAARRC